MSDTPTREEQEEARKILAELWPRDPAELVAAALHPHDAEEVIARALAARRPAQARMYPVNVSFRSPANAPTSVPWDWIARFSGQCKINHYQTLEHLAERGGLSPQEMWAVVHGKDWGVGSAPVTPEAACAWLNSEPWKPQLTEADVEALALQTARICLRRMGSQSEVAAMEAVDEARAVLARRGGKGT